MQKFPSSTGSQLNWKSTTDGILTQKAIDVTHSTSPNLAPMQGSQLVDNTPFPPSPPSPPTCTKAAEDLRYCAICTPLGKDCPGKLAMSSDWNEEDGNTKKEDQE